MEAARAFPIPVSPYTGDRDPLADASGDALYASKICSYAQGMALLRRASEEYRLQFELQRDRPHLAGGVHHPRPIPGRCPGWPFNENPNLSNLLMAPFFREEVLSRHDGLAAGREDSD